MSPEDIIPTWFSSKKTQQNTVYSYMPQIQSVQKVLVNGCSQNFS